MRHFPLDRNSRAAALVRVAADGLSTPPRSARDRT